MSDSELSDVGPSDDVLEQELRQVVRGIVKSGKLEELTVKRVRAAAEKNLGVDEGFYKREAWKDRSKTIIEYEAVGNGSYSDIKQLAKRRYRLNKIPPKRRQLPRHQSASHRKRQALLSVKRPALDLHEL
jgi:DEK C terminal domain